ETEEKAFKAASKEEDGDLKAALELWEEIREKALSGWKALAEKRAALAARALDQENQWQKLGPQPKLTGLEEQAFKAWETEKTDKSRAASDFGKLKEKCETEMKEGYQDWTSETRYWHLYAARKVKELK